MTTNAPITISYSSLLLPPTPSLRTSITSAFSSSPSSLGLLLITDLPPTYPSLRLRLLLLSNTFASLPPSTREKYSDKKSKWSFGWSEGKESMNGVLDHLKGSYYNNPSYDQSPPLIEGQEGFKNVWPSEEDCQGFEEAFKELCRFMVGTGELLARACDGLVEESSSKGEGEGEGMGLKSVEELIKGSRSSKARLLHYFPRKDLVMDLNAPPKPSDGASDKIDDSWCGTHIDHSLLTALCPAIYLFHPIGGKDGGKKLEPLVIPAPSKETGLFIKTRAGETIKGAIPENCIAFQTGETLELLTSNQLAATPHFVNSTATTLSEECLAVIREKKRVDPDWEGVESGTVSRETLAVFLQPNTDEVVSKDGETFGEFTTRVLNRHY